jgi:hypothetical protein
MIVLEKAQIQSLMFRSIQSHGLLGAIVFGGLLLAREGDGAENLSPLGVSPDWTALERYQETITRDDFTRLLESVYCPNKSSAQVIKVEPDSARILESKDRGRYFTLRFAKSEATRRPIARRWATVKSLPPRKPSGPLSDLRVALDPGHIGGEWAKIEERWFQVGDAPPVHEGDMTLRLAQMIATRLKELGAKVSLVRDKLEPVTEKRPGDFVQIARTFLQKSAVTNPREDFDGPADPGKEQTVRWQSEMLFYRNSEIRQRAEIVNNRLRPDVVLCLHFNAEAWGDPKQPTLVDKNHLHFLVNGCYLEAELDFDDERFEMLRRLLSRAYLEEITLAEKLAETMVKKTQLPAYEYITGNAAKVGTSGYVYARNLLATRLYHCPTIFLEPYVMNSHEGFARIQAGDYEGTRTINGKKQPSIFREYTDNVVNGLLDYYKARE